MKKITAVILTYNRKELLKRCLDAVYSQTRPCDSVMVIDNASHDGTEQQLLEAVYPNLKVYVLSRNIGAAGGFSAAFRLAYQSGADSVWMMDDDVIPQPDALQHLLKAEEQLRQKDIGSAFLISSSFTESGLVLDTPGLSIQINSNGYSDWPAMLEYGMVSVRRATFASILVPRTILAEHGLPIASMFFWGEDTEYTLRISQDKPGFLVGASKVLHLRQANGPLSILSETNPVRIKYHRYFTRNKIFIARKYSQHYRQIVLNVYLILRLTIKLLCKGQFLKARIVLQGLLEGLLFFPSVETADTPIESLDVSARSLEPSSLTARKVIKLETAHGALARAELSPSFSEPQNSRGGSV